MKLIKAKEILELNIKLAGKKMPPDTLEALKLSIEAIKRVKACRPVDCYAPEILLPGETVE